MRALVLASLASVASLASLGVAGCAGDALGPYDMCQTSLSVTPSGNPVVGTPVRVSALVINEFGGVPTYEWRVRYNQTDVSFNGQGSEEISFTPDEPGTYDVDMTPSAAGGACQSRQAMINVVEEEPGTVQVRLRVTPPLGVDVPPTERIFPLPAAPTFSLGAVVLEPGVTTSGNIGMAAYLRFIPSGEPEAVVETYANASGAYSARTQLAPHHILIQPVDPAYPPQVFSDNSLGANETYTLSPGVAITGVVRQPGGTPLAGAKIQVFQHHASGIVVPSTIGTSGADGTFTLRSHTANGTDARVVVTPPIASGLPRLETSSAGFDFTQAITVTYASSLVTRNVSGTSVVRGGSLANAKVTIVGTLPFSTAGTIAAGASSAANGSVRVPLTANGSGVLPSALVPAASLFAVVEPANTPGDSAVVAFDTSTAVPSTINAPAMIPFDITTRYNGLPLAGARLEMVPTGALAMAGVGPTVLVADEAGVIDGATASGALYKGYLTDPSRRGAPRYFPALSSQMIASQLQAIDFALSLVISGTLHVQGQTNRIDGAAVQVFCNTDDQVTCEGLERDRPLGEDASTSQGTFELAVARPAGL